jgi:polyribonucleotide nucleotidyltransferase
MREDKNVVFDMIACGKDGMINMIEVGSKQVSETEVNEALSRASKEIELIQDWQKKVIKDMSVEKVVITFPELTPGTEELFKDKISPRLKSFVFSGAGKKGLGEVHKEWINIFSTTYPEGNVSLAEAYFEEMVNNLIHDEAIDNNQRADGRGMDEIRPLFVQAGGVSPILHGSGIFYRGGTHVMSTLTLGSPQDALVIDGVVAQEDKRFMHHYNFPPFSTGETGKIGGTNRRMIGHGALAEKALSAVIPEKEVFPYTVRLVSEAFASNGSTSMGSVCASTLALMDGGVPIVAPVAGIASGLMMREKNGKIEYKVLTDIQGPEDHHGDMDFKVAGTRNGITAVQMDVKVSGIPLNILAEALEKAKTARYKILDLIEKEIPKSREKISANAPEIIVMKIKPDQIGLVIGTGGKTINEIRDKTLVEDISIEDDGTVFITGKNESASKAKEIIYGMTREYLPGEKFEGEVVKLMEFGAFVRIGPNAEGLVHVSEFAPFRVESPANYVKEGDKVPVTLKEIDDKGRMNLSIKVSDPNFFTKKEEVSQPRNSTPRFEKKEWKKR